MADPKLEVQAQRIVSALQSQPDLLELVFLQLLELRGGQKACP